MPSCKRLVALLFVWLIGVASSVGADPTVDAIVFVPGIVFGESEADEIRRVQRDYWKPFTIAMKNSGGSQHMVEILGRDVTIEAVSKKNIGPSIYYVVFSAEAALDGLVYRSLELSHALSKITKLHRGPIALVGHSAGGLISRIVMQEAIPGVNRPSTVKHVISIGTPHQGSAVASNFGKLFGEHVDSLRTTAPLIVRLNKLPLPQGVHFTSFVVGSFGVEAGKPGHAYKLPFGKESKSTIPRHFLYGGDEVVHSITQNLAFTETGANCAAIAPQYLRTIVFRHQRPLQKGNFLEQLFSREMLHTSVLKSDDFCKLVCNTALGTMSADDFRNREARCIVQCHIEKLIKEREKGSEVVSVKIEDIQLQDSEIHYKALGVWKLVGTSQGPFVGKIPVKIHPLLGVIVAE